MAGLFAVAPAALASSLDQAVAYQLDPAHDGYQTGDAITAPLSSIWSITLPATVSYPLIVNGVVYVTSGTNLYAIEQATGTTLWSRGVGSGNMGLAYDAGQIFTVTDSGALAAYDASTGDADWGTPLVSQSLFTSAPTAADGDVYTGGAGSGGTVYGVSQATGQVIWTANVENGDHSSPAVDSNGVYVTYAGDQDYDFDPLSGTLLWHYGSDEEGGGGKTPVLGGGELFGRDAVSGNVVLSAAAGGYLGTFSSTPAPAAGGGMLYTVYGGTLTAIYDWGAGVNDWTFSGDSELDTPPLVVGSLTFVGSDSGNVYAVNSSGTSVWSANVGTAIAAPDEQNEKVLTGMAAGEGTLVVPAGDTLSAFAGASVGTGTPQDQTAPSVSDVPLAGQPVGADAGTWTALPTGYTYQWWLCDSEDDPCTEISGATGEAYTPTSAEIGDSLEVGVGASNGDGSASPVLSAESAAITAAPVPVPTSAPVNVTTPTITDPDPIQGETITATSGTWTEEPSSYSYQWFYCEEDGCGPEGPPSSSDAYTVQPDDIGDQLYVEVTASNDIGPTTEPADSSLSATVGTLGPVSVTRPTIGGTPQVGSTLTGSVGTWTGNPTSFETQWLSCDIYGILCNQVGVHDASTYTPTAADLGDVIHYAVYAIDADGHYSELALSNGAGPVTAAPATTPLTTTPPLTTSTKSPTATAPVSVTIAATPTRAEQLASALKACLKLPKHKRAACAARARKRFGPKKHKSKHAAMRTAPGFALALPSR